MEVLAFLEVIKGQRFFSVMPPLTSLRDSLYKFPSLTASFPKMPLGMPSCISIINKVGNLFLVNKIKRVDSHIDTPENFRWFALGLCFFSIGTPNSESSGLVCCRNGKTTLGGLWIIKNLRCSFQSSYR